MSHHAAAMSGYAAALAELPIRAREHAAGSVVVLDGQSDWGARLRDASDAGAAAVILCDPGSIESDLLLERSRIVAVDRPRLRHDVIADARPDRAPRAVLVECRSEPREIEGTLRDAIGWGRELAGGALELRSSTVTPRAVMLELTRAATAVSVVLAITPSTIGWMRALTLDSDRTEIAIQGTDTPPSVTRSSRSGRLELPPRYETRERVMLRRVFDALDAETVLTDVDDLLHDQRLAQAAYVGNLLKSD